MSLSSRRTCRHARGLVLLGAGLAGSCADGEGAQLALTEQPLAHEGPWSPDEQTLAQGDQQYVAYEGAGPWRGEPGCAGGLLPGARVLGEALALRFPQVSMVGGYACRPIRGGSANMSLHGAGRALDLHIPTVGVAGDADNDLGDSVGAFLIAHAQLLGVQFVIWDAWSWGAARGMGQKGRVYTGVNPHHDHLHVELSVAAAQRESDWFSAALEASDAALGDGESARAQGDANAPEGSTGDASALEDRAGDAGVDEGGPRDQPKPERPIMEPPELDDDPLHERAAPLSEAPGVRSSTVYGSTCSLAPTARASGTLAWLVGLLFGFWRVGRSSGRDAPRRRNRGSRMCRRSRARLPSGCQQRAAHSCR